MKIQNQLLSYLAILFLIIASCGKKTEETPYQSNPIITVPPQPLLPSFQCGTRPVVNVNLVPVGSLSIGRAKLKCATAGSKILFAGGWTVGDYSSRVDIYDTITKTWSIAGLTNPYRDGMAVATVGDNVLFAGGANYDEGYLTSRVDIYNATSNTWSTAELSEARHDLAAVTLGNKVFFAGGAIWRNIRQGSDVIDIYDNKTNTWTTATLSEGRYELTATAVGNKIYFAGGINNMYSISRKIDVFDSQTNSWSISQLYESKTGHAAIAVNQKIFWAGGAKTSYQGGYLSSNVVEIKDVVTGVSTFDCITSKARFDVVIKNNHLVFFTGNGQSTQIDIFDTTSSTWSIGMLPFRIDASAIISVNNTIYVAGGFSDSQGRGPYLKEVWKLEF